MPAPPKSPFAALAALRDTLPAARASATGPATSGPRPVNPTYDGKLVVARSKKGRGGKTVTTITGLHCDATALAAVAKELRVALGCGATTEGALIVVQGDQEARARAFLEKKGARRIVMGTPR